MDKTAEQHTSLDITYQISVQQAAKEVETTATISADVMSLGVLDLEAQLTPAEVLGQTLDIAMLTSGDSLWLAQHRLAVVEADHLAETIAAYV